MVPFFVYKHFVKTANAEINSHNPRIFCRGKNISGNKLQLELSVIRNMDTG